MESNNILFTESDDGGNLAEITRSENPAQTLADMPEFDEYRAGVEANQEKSFTNAKRDEKLPEDIRDKSDYQEFIAEQRAHIKEHEVLDDKLFESIKSIEDSDSRDLATAILPFYYNQSIQRQSEDKQNTRHSAMRDTMQAIVDCVKGDKVEPDGITKVLFEKDKKYFDQDNHDVYRIFRIVEGNEKSPSILEQLKEGQKTENLDLSEANFNTGARSDLCEFNIKTGEDKTKNMNFKIDGLLSAKENQRNATKIMLSMADNLTKKINEADAHNSEKTFVDRSKMSIFWKAAWTSDGDIEKTLTQRKDSRVNDLINYVKDTIDSANFDRHNSNISFDNTRLINLVAIKELSDEFTRQKESQLIYNRSLKLGKKLLGGENWKNINIHDIYESEE